MLFRRIRKVLKDFPSKSKIKLNQLEGLKRKKKKKFCLMRKQNLSHQKHGILSKS
jgi:hypothetical protein